MAKTEPHKGTHGRPGPWLQDDHRSSGTHENYMSTERDDTPPPGEALLRLAATAAGGSVTCQVSNTKSRGFES